MHRREEDGGSSSSWCHPGICRRLFRFLMTKQWILGEKELNQDKPERNKLIKKGSRSDIPIYFKQIADSEDNGKRKNDSPGSPSQESQREIMITLANGSDDPKKRLHEKGKMSMPSEWSPKQQITQPHRRLKPLLNDINKKSDAFIKSAFEKMR